MFWNSSESTLAAVKQQESFLVPFAPVPPNPSSCYCLCCIFRIDRRAFSFLITFSQCKKNQSRQDTLWLGSEILQPGSLLQFSCPYLQIYLRYDMQYFPLILWLLYRLLMLADFAVRRKNIFPPFSFPSLSFCIPTTSLTKTSKSGGPEEVLKEASYIFSYVVRLFSFLHFFH